jgi:hypothetical protein
MPLVVRWVTEDVGRDDEAVLVGAYGVVAKWREIEERISTCPRVKMEMDRMVLERVLQVKEGCCDVASVKEVR